MAAIDDYRAAAVAYETAKQEEARTAQDLADATATINRYGPLPPSSVLTAAQIQDRARKHADLARAEAAHRAAAEDLTAKTAARDAAWAALIAES